jgi:hypothetical protein
MKWTIAALALLGAQAAEAATPPACVTREQVSDATLFILPTLLDAVADKCRASLPPRAYLLNGGRALSRKLAATSDQHWAGAKAAVDAFGGGALPDGLSADTMRGVLRDMVTAKALAKLTPADCARIDDAAEALSPLPPQNIGRLTALLIQLGAGDKGKGLKICP